MGDSYLSFFDDEDFNFANSEHGTTTVHSKNQISLNLFNKYPTQDGELTGFITILVAKKLRKGLITLVIETSEKLRLPVINQSKTIEEEIQHIKNRRKEIISMKKTQNRKKSKKKVNPLYNSMMRKYNRIKIMKSKFSNFMKLGKNSMRPLKIPVQLRVESNPNMTTLRYENINLVTEENRNNDENFEIKKINKTVRSRVIELFYLNEEYVFDKPLTLVLPFCINLNHHIPSSRNYHFGFDEKNYKSKFEQDELVQEQFKLTSCNSKNNLQMIKVVNKARAIYIPKKYVDEAEKQNLMTWCRKLHYIKNNFQVLEDIKLIDIGRFVGKFQYQSCRREIVVEVGSYRNCFKRKRIQAKCILVLQKKYISNMDRHLNFVFKFDKKIKKKFKYLEIVLKSKYEEKNSTPSHFLEKVNFFDSFSLDEKFPKKSKFQFYEFVKKIDLRFLSKPLETMECTENKISHHICFFLSSSPFTFEKKIIQEELLCYKHKKKAMVMKEKSQEEYFCKLISKVEKHRNMLSLPHIKMVLPDTCGPHIWKKREETLSEINSMIVLESQISQFSNIKKSLKNSTTLSKKEYKQNKDEWILPQDEKS